MDYKNIVLVTGGAGFIGSAFLRILVPKHPDWFFINLDALTYAGDLKKVESISESTNYTFVHGNICDRKLVEKLFEEYPINWVVNFAAESHVDNSIKDSTAFIQTNIAGTHVLLDVAKQAWELDGLTKPNNKYRFLQISTDEVYGSLGLSDKSWIEEDPLLPNSPYAASKASAELLCMSFFKTYNFPVIITRSSNNYGPYQNKEKLIPKVVLNSIKNCSIPIYGKGENIRNWIYVVDNCDAIAIVLNKGQIGETYNIGGDIELSNNNIIDEILIMQNKPSKLKKYVEDRLGHDLRYSLDSHKIKGLGWRCRKTFEEGIIITVKHYNDIIALGPVNNDGS
jgi:dTDP-glucose 4,6-dehydratase